MNGDVGGGWGEATGASGEGAIGDAGDADTPAPPALPPPEPPAPPGGDVRLKDPPPIYNRVQKNYVIFYIKCFEAYNTKYFILLPDVVPATPGAVSQAPSAVCVAEGESAGRGNEDRLQPVTYTYIHDIYKYSVFFNVRY